MRQLKQNVRITAVKYWPAFIALLVGLLLVSVADGANVVDSRLQLTVSPKYGALRGQAPLALQVRLSWSDSRLLEGRLWLKWYVDQTHLGTWVSPEMALADSSVTRTVLLPPVIMPHDKAICSVQGEFLTDRRTYDLEIHDVAVPLDWRRTCVVGICRPPPLRMEATDLNRAPPGRRRLVASLRLEQFVDGPFRKGELRTMAVDVDPADMPTGPLEMMAFDVLVIPAENLSKLQQDHLEGLTRWVEAGGSLCCLIDGPVPELHVEFLNQLAGGDPVEAAYLQVEEGRLLPVAGGAKGIDRFRCGLGRLVVVRGAVDYDGHDWQRALLFLWKVRRDRLSDWEQDRPWPLAPTYTPENYVVPLSLGPVRQWPVRELTSLLLPDIIQGIPLLTVCVILGAFLVAIAPGDYLLLGWLRRRRWTWVLFPVMSLLFTWFTMWLAERHLGATNHGRTITVVDLSSDGRPVRTSKIDLLYSASSRVDLAEQTASMMVPVDPQTKGTLASRRGGDALRSYEPPWTYIGNLPGQYVVRRDVSQWSPRLARTTKFGPPGELSRSARIDLDSLRSQSPSATFLELGRGQTARSTAASKPPAAKIASFVRSLSRGGDSRFFSLVSQVSPTAAGNWEDLALLDPSDPNQRLRIAIIEETEGRYLVYRQLVSGEN